MNVRLILMCGALTVFALNAKAQSVMAVTGAPFSATWLETTDTGGNITTTKVVAARSNDGSVYRAIYKDGRVDSIEIEDVPHEKHLQIRPQLKEYTEGAAPRGKWVTRTVAEHRAILERWNIEFTRQTTDQKKESTPLGTKVIDGMTIYGHHYVRYSGRFETFHDRKVETSTLIEMKHGEPDASLFVVPGGYTLTQR